MQAEQATQSHHPLLATKLHTPQPRRDLVPCPCLFEQLTQGLNNKLTLVSAPAGFGKTTLLSQWIADFGLRDRSVTPKFSWLALDAGDNDPVRFGRYLIAACQKFDPTIGQAALAQLQSPQQPVWENLLTLLINDLAQLSGKTILVLEDYQMISAAQIHESLIFLLDHLPATLHLVITTRSDPPLPLARLRAKSELNEIRAADLRFSLDEIALFFQPMLASLPNRAIVERVEARTEGWVTGLRLVALAFQGKKELDGRLIEPILTSFTGSRGHIFAYFIAEVLNTLSAPLQEFLLRTSMLDRLNAALCNAVTERQDSATVLEELQQANMFLIPLDDNHQWMRYHALFAEALLQEARRRLGEEQLRALSQRASRWFKEQGLFPEAVEHALSAEDFPLVAELIEQISVPELVENEYSTLRRWLEQLPTTVLHAHPSLCMLVAMAIFFTSDRRAAATAALFQPPLQVAEDQWRKAGNWHKLGGVLAFRAWTTWMRGERSPALKMAGEALTLLSEGETQWRGICLALIGEEELLTGNLHAARQTFTQSRAFWMSVSNIYGTLANTLALADVCLRQGDLQEAAQYYQWVRDEAEQRPMNPQQATLRKGAAHLGLAIITLEWNDLEEAEKHTQTAITFGQQADYAEIRLNGLLLLARIKQAHGQSAEAQQMLHALTVQMPQRHAAKILHEVLLWQARQAFAGGDLMAVERFIAASQQGDSITRLQEEQIALLMARLQIAQGETTAVQRLLAEWRSEAHLQGRRQSELQIMILQSLAYFAVQDLTQAKATLMQTLIQAQEAGYQRLFLDEGEAMNALLRLLWSEVKEDLLANYVRNLLLAFARQSATGALQPQSEPTKSPSLESILLIEPLSQQEHRVLQFLVGGLSNGEIAQQLIVSVNTVKTQVQSIFRKLNVNSRQEAREAARQLQLL